MTLDTSGPTSMKRFAVFDRDSRTWRTSPAMSTGVSKKSSETWPKQGMTLRGVAYELQMLERRTDGSVSSSLPLLPTPNAHESGSSPEAHLSRKPGRQVITSLGVLARGGLLPTPTVGDSAQTRNRTANRSDPASKHHSGTTLTDALLPTPTAHLGRRPADATMDPTRHDNPDRSRKLTGVPTLLPSSDGKASSEERRLNPRFVEFLMGLPEGWVTDVSLTHNNSRHSATASSPPKQPSPSPSFTAASSRPEEHKVCPMPCDTTAGAHPAPYSVEIINALRNILPTVLPRATIVHDPFAGDGKRLGALCDELGLPFSGCDIEDWPGRDERIFVRDSTTRFAYPVGPHIIVTSPTYNNGVNDHFEPKDDSRRLTYRSRLGRPLHVNNTGRYSGRASKAGEEAYWRLNEKCVALWPSTVVVNVKDSVRSGTIYRLVDQWEAMLEDYGYAVNRVNVETPGWRLGTNSDARVDNEVILIGKRSPKEQS